MKGFDIEYQRNLEKASNTLFGLRRRARKLLDDLGKGPSKKFHLKMYRLIQKLATDNPYKGKNKVA